MRVPLVVAIASLIVAACRGAEPARRAPPGAPAVGRPVAGAAPVSRWDTAAGPALVINSAPDESVAAVVVPNVGDSADALLASRRAHAIGAWTVDLFGRGGLIGVSPVDSLAEAGGECQPWPTARLATLSQPWSVGVAHGRAVSLLLDSIEHLATSDSAGLAASITRIVSALPGDTVGVFRGLPYTVRAAWLFDLPEQTRVVISDVLRVLAEEANPREERIFLIAEREGDAGTWRPSYFVRDWGPEDAVTSVDVLAVVALGPDRTPTIIVSRDAGPITVYGLLQRSARGSWQLRWSSAPAGC